MNMPATDNPERDAAIERIFELCREHSIFASLAHPVGPHGTGTAFAIQANEQNPMPPIRVMTLLGVMQASVVQIAESTAEQISSRFDTQADRDSARDKLIGRFNQTTLATLARNADESYSRSMIRDAPDSERGRRS